jgi:hypothetical protein
MERYQPARAWLGWRGGDGWFWPCEWGRGHSMPSEWYGTWNKNQNEDEDATENEKIPIKKKKAARTTNGRIPRGCRVLPVETAHIALAGFPFLAVSWGSGGRCQPSPGSLRPPFAFLAAGQPGAKLFVTQQGQHSRSMHASATSPVCPLPPLQSANRPTEVDNGTGPALHYFIRQRIRRGVATDSGSGTRRGVDVGPHCGLLSHPSTLFSAFAVCLPCGSCNAGEGPKSRPWNAG